MVKANAKVDTKKSMLGICHTLYYISTSIENRMLHWITVHAKCGANLQSKTK